MSDLFLLSSWAILMLVLSVASIVVVYRKLDATQTLLHTKIIDAEKDLFDDLGHVEESELNQTEMGKELLSLIKSEHPQLLKKQGYVSVSTTINLSHVKLGSWQLVGKRIFDLVFAFATLVFVLPLMFLISLLIKFDSPGPVFYIQDRIGRGGRRFRMYKFRVFQIKSALPPRITPLGRFLRKTSLDELPQLFNVIKGEMSIVGPRPLYEFETPSSSDLRRQLLTASPGITGLAEVKKRHKPLSVDEIARIELEYIQNQSLWLDIKILLAVILRLDAPITKATN